ncbi:energy-coupling factor transport system permease protein [Anaerobacterium chartisolvens]|uniref:Energy-coupling factor transport system permease protein n=1 Tax=Anaerobacterium chartisolvens TaxID=1297424 RepID=A0A369BE05_9FIRM|nr:energy-coupling factor transporter transmembrane component T [Anaerobacterium chartisolvens]RCX18838.1 energy-coupling factor transport system permease protein [Anaerobacterium chartisolvens]
MYADIRNTEYHPLVKFILIVVISGTAFTTTSYAVSLIPCVIFALLLCFMKNYRLGMGMLAASLLLCAAQALAESSPNEYVATLGQVLEAFRKILTMVMGAVIFYGTTETTDLIKALERIRIPRCVVVPLAVTLRFIPTIQSEFSAIRDAMNIRGIPIGAKGFLTHPLKQTEYMLVPLLMRSARIADELSASCITRGINSARAKTSYKSITVSARDYMLIAAGAAVCAAIVIIDSALR